MKQPGPVQLRWMTALALALSASTPWAQGAGDTTAPRQSGTLEALTETAASRQGVPTPEAVSPEGSFSALPALLQQARTLLPDQPEAAWRLLEPQTWHYAGSRDFDYLLGVAALDSHRASEAVMALERVLNNHPDDIPARTELVRAYLALGERQSAHEALQQLMQAQALPDDARQSIQRYLDIISRQPQATNRRWQLTANLTAGQDSNVNAGSTRSRWVVDDGQVLTPLAENRPQSSPFLELGLQFQHSLPLSEALVWSNGLQGSQRMNTRQHPQDTGMLGASSGLAWTRGAHRLSAALNLQQMWLHGHRFRRASGVLAQWQFDPDPQHQLGLYAQLFRLDFDDQPLRDARRTVLGLTWARALAGSGNTVFIANPYGGQESPRQSLPVLDFRLAGLRLGLQRDLGAGWRGNLGVQWEERRHRGPDPLFGRIRHDRQLDLRLGAEYPISPRLLINPQLLHTRNHATLAPNDFRRTQLLVDVQYRW